MMYPRYRTMERYEFIKGIITEISDTCVHIVPYETNEELIAYFDPTRVRHFVVIQSPTNPWPTRVRGPCG